jgi:hypothetical protein
MINSKSVFRALVLTAALAACAAPIATARVGDVPLHGGGVSTPPRADRSLPPRVDGIGVQPRQRTGVAAVPITQPSQRRGFDSSSAAIAVVALLSLTLLGLAGWSTLRGARATRA